MLSKILHTKRTHVQAPASSHKKIEEWKKEIEKIEKAKLLTVEDLSTTTEELTIIGGHKTKKTSKTDKKFLEWLDEDLYGRSMQLIEENDNKFKVLLDKYKYCRDKKLAVKYRQEAKSFLYRLNELLSNQLGLCKNEITFSDICIFPFVRQFAFVDYEWFLNCQLDNLNDWLQNFLNSELFLTRCLISL